MKRTTLLVLASIFTVASSEIICPANFYPVGEGCYRFFDNIQSSYLECKSICQNYGGDLIQVDSCEEHQNIFKYIKEEDLEVLDGYWTSATDILQEDYFQWPDGSAVPRGAPFWGRADGLSEMEPQNETDENCLAMLQDDGFYLHNEDCFDNVGFSPLCQIDMPPNGLCPSPYLRIGAYCVQFLHTVNVPFDDAQTICLSSGGGLAIIDKCDMFQPLIQAIEINNYQPNSGYWVGGYRHFTNRWKWLNGEDVYTGTPFFGRDEVGPLQPRGGQLENCVELNADDGYYFNDEVCTLPRSPLCEIQPVSTTTDTVQTTISNSNRTTRPDTSTYPTTPTRGQTTSKSYDYTTHLTNFGTAATKTRKLGTN